MILWTIQDQVYWDNLRRDGYIIADPELCKVCGMYNYESFQSAYAWIIERMKERIPNSPDNQLPLWGWYQWESRLRRRPDLRSGEYRDFHGFRLEIQIPDEQVLLSDFTQWHHILNNWHIEDDYYRDLTDEEWDAPIPDYTQEEKEATWVRVFDLTQGSKERYHHIQATFWRLNLEQVIDVTEFGKNKKEPVKFTMEE